MTTLHAVVHALVLLPDVNLAMRVFEKIESVPDFNLWYLHQVTETVRADIPPSTAEVSPSFPLTRRPSGWLKGKEE